MIKFVKRLSSSVLVRRASDALGVAGVRCTSTADTTSQSKQVAVQGTESEQRLRVRRARPSDVPRVMRFVREHVRVHPAPLPHAHHLLLCDYVARALAQGHTMVAEQHNPRRGWHAVRGLALATNVCAWDARLLERWACCLRCPRSRRALALAAHCLRAPALHDKYRVHNILQISLIAPPDNKQMISVLAKSAIQRGRDIGFPVIRFDVNNEEIAKVLDELQMKKEWELAYEVLPEALNEKNEAGKECTGHFVTVYTTFTQTDITPHSPDKSTPLSPSPEPTKPMSTSPSESTTLITKLPEPKSD